MDNKQIERMAFKFYSHPQNIVEYNDKYWFDSQNYSNSNLIFDIFGTTDYFK